MEIIEKIYKLFLLIFVMKNPYDYFAVRWSIKDRGKVYFKTKPDRLCIEIDQTDIRKKEATECLYILAKLLYNKILNSYDEAKNEVGICVFNKKTFLEFDLFLIGNIVYPALSADFFIEEYDNDFFLVTVKDKYKFIIRKKIKQDIKVLKYTFVKTLNELHDEYGKYLPDIKDKIVLDIGGYIGDTAVYFSNLGASMVYVYEPHPALYHMLVKNIELNNLKNVKTVNYGASNENSIISTKEDNVYSGPTGTFGLNLSKEREGKKVEIRTISFKEIIESIGEIDFMKMDCEGCEFQALLSCDRLHLKRIKKMVVEYHSNPERIITHLGKNGFSVKVEGDLLIASLL